MKLKVVELCCPYDNWDNEQVRKSYNDLITLKLKGYGDTYSDVLPIDSYDLISDHIIICEENDNDFVPICSMKHTKYSIVKRFQLPFPCMPMLKSLNESGVGIDQYESIKSYLGELDNTQLDTYYSGAMTIDSKYRGRTEINFLIKNLIFTSLFWYKIENSLDTGIAIGLKHVKTDLILENMGYQKAIMKNRELNYFTNRYFNHQEALLLYLNQLSEEGNEMYMKYKKYFDERAILTNHSNLKDHLRKNKAA